MQEEFLSEDYPVSFDMEEFKKIPSYAGRLKYAEQNLPKKIGSGSSRTVFQIDNDKVLKIAKNKKGLAQNEQEESLGNDWYIKDLVATVYDAHPNGEWIESQLAQKINKANFERLTGVKIEDLDRYLKNKQEENKGKKIYFPMDPALIEKLDNNEFVASILDFMMNYDMPAGDLGRLSSYGVVDGDKVVVIDYGLNQDVWDTHYVREQVRKIVAEILK
jgi:hypothetical protein